MTAPKTNLPAIIPLPLMDHSLFDDQSFDLEDGAAGLMERFNITTKKQLFGFILSMYAFGNRDFISYLLAEGLKKRLVEKADLVSLYLTQFNGQKRSGNLITLSDIWVIPQRAFPKKKENDLLPMLWFSQDEILDLADAVLDVHHVDLELFFKHWFYNQENPVRCTENFLKYWFEKTGETFSNVSGKVAALIAIAYQSAYPENVNLDEIIDRFSKLCQSEPRSHGRFRYLSLAFMMAANNNGQKAKILEAWVVSIIEMIAGGRSLFTGAQLSIEILIRTQEIPEKDKKRALRRIHRVARETAQSYMKLVADAEEMVRVL